ncbi:FecR family protein [Pedobacter namyangjuensis]|uniref:FecR family protein n=1 Tax=Pedobacter namyangjuensis TaxID=600626 RepID=UPI0013B43873|nr:FecR domain-containing protein [Pedobacter namyangjuensis]
MENPTDENLKNQVNQFRNSSKSNEDIFQQIEKIWRLSSRAAVISKIDDNKTTEFLDKFFIDVPVKRFSTPLWLKGLAASLLIATLSYWIFSSKTEDINQLNKTTIANEIDTVNLVDGSIVIMAENSALTYPDKFDDSVREISLLRGKAFFKVAKNSEKPFTVILNKSKVSVLGTSFNISAHSDKIDLDVKTGKVSFSPYKGGTTLVLTAGQALSYDIAKSQIVSKNSQNSDAWLTKELIFVDTPLEEVCEQLTKYYNQEIKLEHTKKIVKKFNATFRGEELNDVLSLLKATYNLKIEKSENHVLLRITN